MLTYMMRDKLRRACASQGRNTVVLPIAGNRGNTKICNLSVVRRFGFEASLLRSGAVAVDNQDSADTALFFVHGAPLVIQQLVCKDTLPADCQQVTLLHAVSGNLKEKKRGEKTTPFGTE